MESVVLMSELKNENDALKAEVSALRSENSELNAKVSWLTEQLTGIKRTMFGSSSEKSAYDFIGGQLN